MFDTKKFGAYVARKRKDADMTQSELAEKLNLTRQAISKYEAGDSFPDVSILIQIAEIFNITLDELIGSGNPTAGETKILKNITAGEETNSVNIHDVVNLAPLVKPSILKEFADMLTIEEIDITHIINLVQYLNDDNVLRLLKSAAYETLNEEMMGALIPFLDDPSKEVIIKKIIEGESDWRLLTAILPYIENMTLILESAVVDGALPKQVLEMINEYYIIKQGL